ncbi:MAG: DUF3108 domain-containing protein [Elusimicrobia bacterium]|nr:DUF3108 domain-containing protein [Elusimicrobiota bacterium]
MTRRLMPLAVALIAHAGVAGAEKISLSSAALQSPYQLVRGTAAATAELEAMPWFNEELEYEVKWGIFVVGTSNLRTNKLENFNGTPAVRIVSEAKSNGFSDRFYKVRDLNESWIDAKTFNSLGYNKQLREGQFFRDEWVLYDYDAGSYLSRRTGKDGNYTVDVGTMPVPVQDILSSLYYLRTKPLNVGDEVVMDVNTKSTWPLVARVTRKRRIETPAGEFDTVLVEPALRQEGIFVQKGKRLQVYMTDDKRHLPVYLSVDVFFGSVSASLTKVTR